MAPTAHMGKLRGEARDKAAMTGARTVPPRAWRQLRHQGPVPWLEDLLPGLRRRRRLSVGDLHFSQGDGEITFCGAIEMAGWVHMKVELIKGGMAKYGIKNPVFKPSPIVPNYKNYLIFEGISVDESGKQHYLDVNIAYKQACLNAINYLTKFGYSPAQGYALLGSAPVQGTSAGGGHPQRLRHALAADGNLRLRHQPQRLRPDPLPRRQRRPAHRAGQ